MRSLAARDLRLHGFGVKVLGCGAIPMSFQ
jgi:hypothetical protein